jgi:hypothetical protein
MSNFTVGSYSFVVTNPGASPNPGFVQLERQLFFNVTNSQGQMQRNAVTVLGSWDGQPWPPDGSPSLGFALFGGDVNLHFLFLCNQAVLLEITEQ